MEEPSLLVDYDMAVGSSPAPAAAWAAHDAMELEADVTPAEYEMEMEDSHQQQATNNGGHASDEVEMGEAVPTPAPDVDEEIIDYTEGAEPIVEATSTSLLSASAPIFSPTAPVVSSYASETVVAPVVSAVPRKSLADAPPLPDSSDAAQAGIEMEATAQLVAARVGDALEAGLYDDDEPSAQAEPAAAAAHAAEASSTTAQLEDAAKHEADQAAQQQASSGQAEGAAQENDAAHEVDGGGGAHEKEASVAAATADEDELANSRPPPVRVTYQGQDFVLFATAHTPSYSIAAPATQEGQASSSKGTVEVGCPKLAAPASAFSESLDLLCEALRVGESLGDFLDDGTELVLTLPKLDLSVREDDVYAREVTLADLHRLHIGAGFVGSLHLVITEAPRFITRYNALASSVGAGDETIVEDDADNSGTSLHDSEVGYTQYEHGEAGDDGEGDAAEADQTFVTVRGGSAEPGEEEEQEFDEAEARQDHEGDAHAGDEQEERSHEDQVDEEYQEDAAAGDEGAAAGADEVHDETTYDEQEEEVPHEQHYEEEDVDYAEEQEEGAPHVEGQEAAVEQDDEQLEDYEEAEPEADVAGNEADHSGEAHTAADHIDDEEPLIDYDEAVGDDDVAAAAQPDVESAAAEAVEAGDALYEEDVPALPAHTNGKRALEEDLIDATEYSDAALEAKRVKVV